MGDLRAWIVAWIVACAVAVAACKPSNLKKVINESSTTDAGAVVAVCGNGIVEPGEVCDPPAPGKCSADCKSDLSCGNFVVDPGEVCDDGHTTVCQHCSDDCKSNLTCGNGIVDACKGEQCDDGTNALTGACPKCRNAFCGDGFVQSGVEQCDDGTNATNGACPNCQNAFCGDGFVHTGVEQCDQGMANSANAYGPGACTDQCQTAPFCGDAVVQTNHGEQCDNGNNNNANAYGPGACTDQCQTAPFCGDGTVQANHGEACDNGNNNVPAANAYGMKGACTDQCQPAPFCGDGIVQSAFETCDCGNTNGNGVNNCSATCQLVDTTLGPNC